MKQVIQNFKSGELYVDEVPKPGISRGVVLVKNEYSLISAGTERGTVKVGKANLIGKAKQRPDLVAQVLQNIKKEGLKATMDKVQTKLDSLKALGYSSAGVVQASMDSEGYFQPGDRVACAGQDYASHSDFVSVPQNLVVKIPDNVSFKEASFTTLGAIAMQGVRQADPKLGDNVCVIGLGLLGQLTAQILQANGCNVFGIDMSDDLIELGKKNGMHAGALRSDQNLQANCDAFTNGYGFDSVVITAATPSNDPIELTAEIIKKKGEVVIVGAVNMNIPRDPHFYRKELNLKMSCSYGPGRYDVNYEEEGQDYPFAYVRWTENRNMQAFLKLISNKSIDITDLISHEFDIVAAEQAYDIVLGKVKEKHIGILLKYNGEIEPTTSVAVKPSQGQEKTVVGFIGAGSFAQSYLIPNVKRSVATLDTVVTSKGITAKGVASKFEFKNASAEQNDVVNSDNINTVFIATPHNSHAELTLQSIHAGKHVFVEKPLAMHAEELEVVRAAHQDSNRILMVGFNRRFSPISVKIKEAFSSLNQPLVMNFRVNAGNIPKDHWTQLPNVGGGRVIGEMCHFIDLMQFFTDSKPVSVFASSIGTQSVSTTNQDNISVTVQFEDGSLGNLVYVGEGDKSLPKERMEVFGGGKVGVINDFRNGEIYSDNKCTKIKLSGKGHAQEVAAFLDAVKNGTEAPISFDSIYYTTLTTFKILDSLHTGMQQKID